MHALNRKIGTGRAGEFYTAFKLQQSGIDICHVAQSFDLLCTFPSGLMVALEVKTSERPGDRAVFNVKNATTEWIALVWLPAPGMIVCRRSELSDVTARVDIAKFTPDEESSSIRRFVREQNDTGMAR